MSAKGIFFIGSHKVGSTALQEHFTLNSHKLLAAGVLYPFLEPDGIAYALAKAARGKGRSDLNFKIMSPHNHLAYKLLAETTDYEIPARYTPLPSSEIMLRTISAMLEETRAKTLLICAEMLSQLGVHCPQTIGPILDLVGPEQASVYAVLRRPDEYLASWQSQALKFGDYEGRLSDSTIERFVGTCHLDFYDSVAPWFEQVGAANTYLYNYREVRRSGGTVTHFARTFGLRVRRPVKARTSNTGLPYASYEIIRQANEQLPPGAARRFRRWCINHAHTLGLPDNRRVELFGAKNREWLYRYAEGQSRKLGRLIGREQFFDDLEDILTVGDIPEVEASAIGAGAIRAAYLAQAADRRGPQIEAWLDSLQS